MYVDEKEYDTEIAFYWRVDGAYNTNVGRIATGRRNLLVHMAALLHWYNIENYRCRDGL